MRKTNLQKLEELGACVEATEWVASQNDKSLQRLWSTCPRGDWMWWILCRAPGALPTKKQSVAFAKWCAERAKTHATASADAATASAAAATHAAAADAAAAAAAADAARAYAASAYVAYVARGAERLAQADYIRAHFSCPELP